jgi:hypothetical protein
MSAPLAPPRPDWPRLVGDSLKQNGLWHTYAKLLEARSVYPDDLSLRGYVEIVRNTIVREFLGHSRGTQAVPKLSADFLSNFDHFNLNAQGYLVSLIDGRLDVQKLMMLNPSISYDHLHPGQAAERRSHRCAMKRDPQ